MLYSCEMLQLFSPPGDRLHFHGRGQSGSRSHFFRSIPVCSRNLAPESKADAGLNEAFILSGERTMSQVKYCSTTDGRTDERPPSTTRRRHEVGCPSYGWLQGFQMAKFVPPHPPLWRNPWKGRDQILQQKPEGPNTYDLKIWL